MMDQQLTINLDGLRAELQRSLQEVICLVAAGLNSAEAIEVDKLHLPSQIKRNFAKVDGADLEKVRKRYAEWLLECGFRDAIESVSAFLESAHRVLTCWELAVKDKSGWRIPRESWNKNFFPLVRQFHRLGLPDKLDHLSNKHSVEIKGSFREQILSINAARNCFVHRRGVVSALDANEDQNLVVKWSRMKLIVQNEDGDHELVIGETIEKESTISMVFEEKQKVFPLGATITFSVDEFSELTWCFFLFADGLVGSINGYGIDAGFIPKVAEVNA